METLKFKSEKIIGRTNEIKQIQDSLDYLKQGRGKTIIVSGEAGIGKTRLMNETIKYMEKQGVRIVSVYCLPYENTDSYLPFTEILHKIAPDEPLIPRHEEGKHVSLDEVFLVYKSGVLIAHTSKRDRGLDSDVVAGMFTAVQDFVKDSFGDKNRSTSGLRRLEYHDMNILIEHGKNVFIAGLLVGPTATKQVFRDLRNIVELVEKDYQDVLEGWDGNLGKIKGTETVLKMLTSKDYPVEKTMDKSMLDTERLRVFEHMLNIVTNTAKKQPLLLFFDDLQWADPSSLQLLHYLSRNTREHPVLLCGTYRPEELTPTPQGKTHPLKETLQLMTREELVTEIPLSRLKHDDTVDLVKGIFAHSFNTRFTNRLHQETEGNPFFTEELLRTMVLDGIIYRHNAIWEAKDLTSVVIPGSVKDTVMRRINALDKDSHEVLKYAAVIGQIFQFQTLARTTGKDEKSLADILEKIVKQDILHSEKQTLSFDHAKLQEVIYYEIPDFKRSIMHKETARTLEELNKENLSTVAVELAHHYQQAGIPNKTVEYALLAAENAEKKFTPMEAVQDYMTALQTLEKMKSTPENKERQLKTADKIAYMYYITGEWDMSMNYVYVVEKLAKETKNQAMLAESYRNMGMIQVIRAEHDKSMENLHKALIILEKINDALGIAEVYYWMGIEYRQSGKLDEAMKILTKSLAQIQKIDDKGLMAKMIREIGIVHFFMGDYEKSLKLMMTGQNIAENIGDKYEIARAYHNIGDVYGFGLNDGEMAIDCYEKCIKISEGIGFISNLTHTLCDAAVCYARKGEYDKAEEHANRSLLISEKIGERKMIGWNRCVRGIIYKGKQEWKKSEEKFEKGIDILKKIESFDILPYAFLELGEMYKAKGDGDKAREEFQNAVYAFEKLGNKAKVEEVKREMEKL